MNDTARHPPQIHLVDDDAAIRATLAGLARPLGLQVCAWDCADDFLAGFERDAVGAILLDAQDGGLALLDRLMADGIDQPVIVLAGRGRVDLCRRAFKAGATEFLEKPASDAQLAQALRQAVGRHVLLRQRRNHTEQARARYARLSEREREVLAMVVAGLTNKEIARALARSPRTVEVHRARLATKLETDSLAQLVRQYAELAEEDAAPGAARPRRLPTAGTGLRQAA